jgi:hypothetical protein
VTAICRGHYRIPLLFVVCNNRSFFNDELHQERVARIRNRPPENRWIGQRISDPDIDCAALGRAQGAVGFAPVQKTGDLVPTFEQAIAAVEQGQVAVVDVWVEPGYSAVTTAAMLRGTEVGNHVGRLLRPPAERRGGVTRRDGDRSSAAARAVACQHYPPYLRLKPQIAKLSCVEGWNSSSGATRRAESPSAWW